MSVETTLASVAKMVLPKLVELVRGSEDARAEQAAIAKAAWAVALDLLKQGQVSTEAPTEEKVRFISTCLVETLYRSGNLDLTHLSGSGARSALLGQFESALMPLDEAGVGLQDIGLLASTSQVAEMFVDQLTENLLLWGASGPYIRDIAVLLQVGRKEQDSAALAMSAPGAQARMVHAWISLQTEPPQIEVHNDSGAPIFQVVPTPMLIARDLSGQEVARVGGGALYSNRTGQIDPGFGYVWPLPHVTSWANKPLVLSQLHVDYTDAVGRRWRNAHDHIVQLDP